MESYVRALGMRLALLALATGVAMSLSAAALQTRESAMAQETPRIALDADLSNGVCTTLDSEVTVPRNATLAVAACLFHPAEPPEAFTLDVTYDTALVTAPERPDVGSALDDNPDANAGATTFGDTILGKEWDCTSFGVQYPVGDASQYPGGDALINCNANLSNPDNELTSGVLAVVVFKTLKAGSVRIGLSRNTAIAGDSGNTFICDAGQGGNTIPCDGATLDITNAEATPTPVTPTPEPTQAAQQTATAVVVSQTEAAVPNGANLGLAPVDATQTALAQVTPADAAAATSVSQAIDAARATSTALRGQVQNAELTSTPTEATGGTGNTSNGGGTSALTIAVIVVVAVIVAGAAGALGYLYVHRRTPGG